MYNLTSGFFRSLDPLELPRLPVADFPLSLLMITAVVFGFRAGRVGDGGHSAVYAGLYTSMGGFNAVNSYKLQNKILAQKSMLY